MRLLTLPDVLRRAGLTVHEVSGWRTRGEDNFGPLRGITCHHTAGSRTSTDAGELHTLINGSSSAPPPIAQLYLSRTGHWHVVASGVCWHNLIGTAGPNKGYGNYQLIGIEAQHSGAGEPWTPTQYRSYVRGVAALCDGLGVPVAHVAGHKEHQPGQKTDPTFDMAKFRADVSAELDGDDMTPEQVKAAVIEALNTVPLVLPDGVRDRLAAAKWSTSQTATSMLSRVFESAILGEPRRHEEVKGALEHLAELVGAGEARIIEAIKELADRPDNTIELTPAQVAEIGRAAAAAMPTPAQLAGQVADVLAQRLVA